MAPGIVIEQNNFGFALTFTVLNADSTPTHPDPRDLSPFTNASNGSITLYVFTQEQNPTLLFSGLCTITDATNGICTYTVLAGNFPTPLTWDAELEMVQTDGGTPPVTIFLEDTETFSINVLPQHPSP